MTNELAVRQHGFIVSSDDFETMQRMAKAMVASNYFSDVRDVAQAIVKIQAGSELGIPPFAALTGIHVIKNKPVLGANLIATLIKSDARYDYRVDELGNERCVLSFYENGEKVGESSFTIEEARKAGVGNTQPPGKPAKMIDMYPRNMLFSRAISNGARWFTPGIFGGATVYTPDEMDTDVDEEGFVIDVTPPPGTDTDADEVIEGTVESAPEPEPELPADDDLPPSASGNGTPDKRAETGPAEQDKRPRPSAPKGDTDPAGARNADETKAALIATAQDGGAGDASDKQLTYVRSSMSKLVDGESDKAKLLLYHVYGLDSSSELTKGQASALIDWIGSTKETDWQPTERAQLEAQRLLRAFEVERGQQELGV